ncbi:MAG: fumarylacetoacetate hydrolase family protein [Rhizobiales bacterium]|nr:fumarylacetoacetate hydrolase family protein [Hyphomicrobiales bacterium]
MSEDKIAQAAELISETRLNGGPIDLVSELRPASEAEGYRLQATSNHMLAASGLGAVVGHKIGCTTPVMQAFLGIHSPCSGEVFELTVAHERARVRAEDYRRLGVECEIVVALARDIEPRDAPFTPASVADAVGAVMAGIEIVDDRYADYRTFGVPSLIADNFFNAGCVLGRPVREWRDLDLAALKGRTLINDAEVGSGSGAMVVGHPLNALAWLANARGARGLGLKRGEFVFLGSLVETKWLNAGDRVKIEIDDLGGVELAVE